MNSNYPSKLLDISIVIGGNKNLIIPCLESIHKNHKHLANIYVVSNLSSQSICRQIQEKFPRVHLIKNSVRKGFAENHNSIIERTSGKYILILNDDTIILNNAIEKLIDYMDNHPDIGVIAPKLLNPDGSLQHSTYGFPTLFRIFLDFSGIRKLIPFNTFTYKLANIFYKKGKSRFWDHDEICEIDTLKGACDLVRREAMEDVGLMDEVSLAYGEETEWHYRFRKKGWKVLFYPKAEVIHYGEQTTRRQKAIVKQEIKGLLNSYRKHKNVLSYYFLRIIILFIFSFKYIFSLVAFRKKSAGLYLNVIKIVQNPKKVFRGKRIFY